MDYAGEPLLFDAGLRQQLLGDLVQLGAAVEAAFGGVPQVGRARGRGLLPLAEGGGVPQAVACKAVGLPVASAGRGSAAGLLFQLPTAPSHRASVHVHWPQDIEGVRTADGSWHVVQSRPQVLHSHK